MWNPKYCKQCAMRQFIGEVDFFAVFYMRWTSMRRPKLLPSPVPRKTNTALSPNKALSSSVTPLVKKKNQREKKETTGGGHLAPPRRRRHGRLRPSPAYCGCAASRRKHTYVSLLLPLHPLARSNCLSCVVHCVTACGAECSRHGLGLVV